LCLRDHSGLPLTSVRWKSDFFPRR
jgi:hypothetical protein